MHILSHWILWVAIGHSFALLLCIHTYMHMRESSICENWSESVKRKEKEGTKAEEVEQKIRRPEHFLFSFSFSVDFTWIKHNIISLIRRIYNSSSSQQHTTLHESRETTINKLTTTIYFIIILSNYKRLLILIIFLIDFFSFLETVFFFFFFTLLLIVGTPLFFNYSINSVYYGAFFFLDFFHFWFWFPIPKQIKFFEVFGGFAQVDCGIVGPRNEYKFSITAQN